MRGGGGGGLQPGFQGSTGRPVGGSGGKAPQKLKNFSNFIHNLWLLLDFKHDQVVSAATHYFGHLPANLVTGGQA